MTKVSSAFGFRGQAIAVAALLVGVSACGAPEGDDGATEATSSDLLANVPYLGGQAKAQGGTSGDATLFKNKAYFAYIRPDSSIGIIVETNLGGNGQTPTSYGLSWNVAQYGVSLLNVNNNTLYVFFIGSTNLLGWGSSTDGLNWVNGGWQSLPGGVTTPPAAVALNGTPIVYVGVNTYSNFSQILQYNISGNSASGPYTVGVGAYSTFRPSATIWNGGLYLAYKDQLSNGQTSITHWNIANGGWSNISLTGKTGIPGIFPVAAGALEMVYRGPDSHIYRTFTTDGVSFGASYEDTASTTNHAPIPFENWNLSANWVYYIGVDNELYTAVE